MAEITKDMINAAALVLQDRQYDYNLPEGIRPWYFYKAKEMLQAAELTRPGTTMDMVSGAIVSERDAPSPVRATDHDRMKVILALAGRVAEWSVPGADEAAITELTQAIAAAREEGDAGTILSA